MQNLYIRIEDMPSLVSHQLSIIKYVVLKKIFFFLCFDHLIWTWTRTSLDSDSNLFGLGLDSDSNLFGLGLVLDSTKVDLTTALLDSITQVLLKYQILTIIILAIVKQQYNRQLNVCTLTILYHSFLYFRTI